VKVSKLDSLMDQLSELLVMKIRTEQRLNQVHEMQEFMSFWQKEWQVARNAYGRLVRAQVTGGNGSGNGNDGLRLLEYAGNSQERLRENQALLSNLGREFKNDATQMSLAIDELEQEVKRLRMLPLNTITASFGRMVRDLALQAGKEAVLQVVGGDTELDKHVLEQIKDPLTHLLRNAVDHGIEPPARRKMLRKPHLGTITLSAEQIGKDVIIRVKDDGGGLDMDAIRRSVARQGKVDIQALEDKDLAEHIFKIGVSTSPIITDLSGRGVGLDVVRRNVEALHGRCDVDWKVGQGTTFTLTIPLRLTGSRGLLVRVAGQLFAIPNSAVEFILSVKPDQVARLEGHDTVRHGGRSIALVRLGDVVGLPPAATPRYEEEIPVVILASAERRVAFAVDELASEQEIVIKGLGRQLVHVNGIAGATVMGSGEVVLILNAVDLVKMAMRGERQSVLSALAESSSPLQVHAQRRILIVDDSITTRTLEKNILEAAGYTVQLALDGQEALNAIATTGLPDLIVSDIAMPRINGFELTRRVKTNPQLAHLPVILVSSLDSPEDKAQGIEAGADAYITKGSFDQTNLLDTIEQMLLPVEA
jgi:two-component system chemotaxis sensor kinase CheA